MDDPTGTAQARPFGAIASQLTKSRPEGLSAERFGQPSALRNFIRQGLLPDGKIRQTQLYRGQTAHAARRLTVNFQVTILKVLASYPDGFASLADVKRDVAILATSGRDWSERTTRLAARLPGLEIFAQGLVERRTDGWCITEAGRSALELMECRTTAPEPLKAQATELATGHIASSIVSLPNRRRRQRRQRRRAHSERTSRASVS